MTQNVLLLGAGFSRNWGGWLASEVFEYLLGCNQIDQMAKNALWECRSTGGFEAALAKLQNEYRSQNNNCIKVTIDGLQHAISQMFNDMNGQFRTADFPEDLDKFLTHFDAIFTLNQDLLMEFWIHKKTPSTHSIPGMEPVPGQSHRGFRVQPEALLCPSADFSIEPNKKPYFKLHGSCNWVDKNDNSFLVMGGYKEEMIQKHNVLCRYYNEFKRRLADNARLMVIGYSFTDEHINRAIQDAASSDSFKIFIIDPNGVEALEREANRTATIRADSNFLKQLQPCLLGASRRYLLDTFRADGAEQAKISRFFE